MSGLDKHDLLAEVGICSDLTPSELDYLRPHLRPETLATGDWLFRQGDPGDRLFLVDSGRLTIHVNRSDGKEMTLASFEPGSFFGEMSLIDGEPRSAGCRAEVESALLSLSRKAFFELKREHHGFKEYDVRRIIDFFKIANGGGHQGAIGFRYPPGEILDLESFVDRLLSEVEVDIQRQ